MGQVENGLDRILNPKGDIHWDLKVNELVKRTLARGEGRLTAQGALVVNTGTRTGRSAHDKFIVRESLSEDFIFWGDTNRPIDDDIFERVYTEISSYLNERAELFVQNLTCGAQETENLPIRVITESPWHAAFARNMFLRPDAEALKSHRHQFTVLHAPSFEELDGPGLGLNSEAFILIHFGKKLILIGGTQYAGEIKKSNYC